MAWMVWAAWSIAISELFGLPQRNQSGSLQTCVHYVASSDGDEHCLPGYREHTFEQMVASCFRLWIGNCVTFFLDHCRLVQTDPLPVLQSAHASLRLHHPHRRMGPMVPAIPHRRMEPQLPAKERSPRPMGTPPSGISLCDRMARLFLDPLPPNLAHS